MWLLQFYWVDCLLAEVILKFVEKCVSNDRLNIIWHFSFAGRTTYNESFTMTAYGYKLGGKYVTEDYASSFIPLTFESCAKQCDNEPDFYCESFSFCARKGVCLLSKYHPATYNATEMVLETDCATFSSKKRSIYIGIRCTRVRNPTGLLRNIGGFVTSRGIWKDSLKFLRIHSIHITVFFVIGERISPPNIYFWFSSLATRKTKGGILIDFSNCFQC